MTDRRGSGRRGTWLVRCALLLAVLAAPASVPAETLRWTRTFHYPNPGGSGGHGVAVLPGGDVAVVGESYVSVEGFNLAVLRYTPSGEREWTRMFNSGGESDELGEGVAVGSDGSIYAIGHIIGPVAGRRTSLLKKYTPDGGHGWTRIIADGADGFMPALGVCAGADGSVYVVGTVRVPRQNFDLFLQRYSEAGDLVWTRTYNAYANSRESGVGVAVGPDGSVYVVGYRQYPGVPPDLMLQKYASDGTRLWTRVYDRTTEARDFGYAVSVGHDGSVYVAGMTSAPGQWYNLLVQKYSAAGRRIWSRSYNGPDNGIEAGYGVAVGPDGSVFVAGETFVAGEYSNLLLQKYSAGGAHLWTKMYNGIGNGHDLGFAVAASRDGAVYVTGRTADRIGEEILLLQKYK